MKKFFIKTLIGSLVISALLAILVILFQFETDWSINILLTTFIVFPFSITCLCCSSIYEKPKLKTLSLIGIIINIIGCLLYIGVIWDLIEFCLFFCEEDTNITFQTMVTLSLLSTSLAHISLLLVINSNNQAVKKAQLFTIITSIIIDLLLLDSIWLNLIEYNDLLSKLVIITIILMVLGTIITPLLHIATKNKNKEIPQIKKESPNTKCPNCNYDIDPNWKFCPNCNTNLSEQKNASEN